MTPKILYIEDNPENRLLVRALLEAEGYAIVEAEDGLSGLEAAIREQPALILLDINMPGVDGYEVGVILKSFPALSDTPVVAVTAYAMEGDRQRTLAAGCDGYIPKPIDPDEFPRQVGEFLRGKRERLGERELSPYLRELNQRLVYRLVNQVEELRRLNQQFARRALQLEDLHAAVQDITSERGVTALLERLLPALARALGTVSLAVELDDPAGVRVVAKGEPAARPRGVLEAAGGEGGEEWTEVEWTLSLAVLGRRLGTMTACHLLPAGARADEEQLLKIVANQVAIAVENARLLEAEREALRETETLLAVSQAAGSVLDVAEIARRTLREMCRALGADHGGAWRRSPEGDRLVAVAGYRVPKELLATFAETPLPLEVPIVRGTSDQGRLIFLGEGESAARIDHPFAGLLPHRSLLIVPMIAKGELIGGFALVWSRQAHRLMPEEERLVEGMAGQAAIAVENARLLEAEREARERLAASEARYRELFENVIDVVYLHDLDGRILEINEAGVRASGWSREELLAMTLADLLAPGDRARLPQLLRRLAASERPLEPFVVELVRRDGRRLILETAARPVVKDGAPVAILASARDITVKRQLEERQEALVALSRELATEIDLDRLLSRVVDEARRLMAMDSALLLLLEGDHLVFRGASEVPPAMIAAGRLAVDQSLTGVVVRERRPLVYANLAADPVWRETPLVRQYGYRAMLAMPLTVKERTLGVLKLLHREPRAFPHEEVEFLRTLATQAALAIDNARLFTAQREEAEISAGLLRLAEAIEGLQNLDQVLDTVARTTPELLGVTQCLLFLHNPADGTLTPAVASGLSDEHRAAFLAFQEFARIPGVRKALQTQDPVILEGADRGAELPFVTGVLDVRAMLVIPLVSSGRLMGVLGVHTPGRPHAFTLKEIALARGIAAHAAVAVDRAGLFQETQVRLRETETLLTITRAVSSTLDPTETMRRVAREIALTLRADMVGAYLADPAREALHPIAGYHVPRELLDKFRQFPVPIKGHPAMEQAWARRESKWSSEAGSDARIDRASWERFPHQSSLFVPMTVKGEPIGGFFAVWWTERRDFTPEEIRLVEGISDQAAMFIENARLYSEATRRRREAEELARLARMLGESLDAADVGDRIVESSQQLLGGTFSLLRLLEPDGSLNLIAAKGDPKQVSLLPALLPRGGGMAGRAVAEGGPVSSSDLAADEGVELPEGMRAHLAAEGSLAVVAVPLRVKREITGALVVGAAPGRTFSETEVALLQTFADQAAIALENSRLYGDLRAALREVEESQQRVVQVERLRALGEMAGGVAHDFNNTLAIIVGRAEVLLNETEDPELQRQLNVIVKVALDAAQTVKRIQEFTRMLRARPFQQVSLSQLIEETVEVTRSRWKDEAQGRGVHYDVVVEAHPTPPVAGDPAEIREALINIIFNALDAMPEGGRLVLRTTVEGDHVVCLISDTGVGMPEEVRQRVFDPFFTTKGERGTGLGLSVVYGIITRHNAEIDVESRSGEGTTFVIRFPLGREAAEEAAARPAPRSRRKGRILIVDDEPEVASILADFLGRDGHQTVVCHDGESGLARFAEEEPFDAVFTDLGMPGISGWEMARGVKLRRPDTPVVMVTGWGDRIDPIGAQKRGVDYIVSKPFKRDTIREVVAAALGAFRGS